MSSGLLSTLLLGAACTVAMLGYYDSAVVAAVSPEDACLICPHQWGDLATTWSVPWNQWIRSPLGECAFGVEVTSWCEPKDVTAKLIGTAADDVKAGTVVLASFNAG